MEYRREIDGLRALAVLPVIFFHAGLDEFRGGFIGVDVFFVISGYLITKIIIEDLQNRRFSLLRFYERRARRILPALFLLLLCSIFYAFYTSPFYARDIFQSVFATTIFAKNILLYLESYDYFAIGGTEKLLSHTWTLAIEEQFYIAFPFILVLAWRYGMNQVVYLIVSLALISLLLSEWGWRKDPVANYYLTPSRIWELLAGSLAAFVVVRHGVRNSNMLASAGLTAVILSFALFDSSTPFPSLYTLLPVVGVVLVLIYGGRETLVAKFLSIKPLVWIGLISYSAYLWHQPLIVLLERELSWVIQTVDRGYLGFMIVALTMVISTISYLLVEQPFRHRVSKKCFYYVTLLIAATMLATSLLGHRTFGFQDIKLSYLAAQKSLYIDQFYEMPRSKEVSKPMRVDGMPSIIVIGDSMAEDFSKALATRGIEVHNLGLDDRCFEGLLKNDSVCNYKLDELISIVSDFTYAFISTDLATSSGASHSIDLWRALSPVAKVYLVNNVTFKHAADLSYQFAVGRIEISREAVFNTLEPMVHVVNETLKNTSDIKVLDKYSYFCDDDRRQCILYSDNLLPLRFDHVHLTVEGLNYYGERLVRSLCQIEKAFCSGGID